MYLEGLGEESLYLPGSRHLELVLFRQLVHTQDSNDVLQGLVVLPIKQLRDVYFRSHH